MEEAVQQFYELVGQNLKSWMPEAPKVTNSESKMPADKPQVGSSESVSLAQDSGETQSEEIGMPDEAESNKEPTLIPVLDGAGKDGTF